jgi:hypothetical protein
LTLHLQTHLFGPLKQALRGRRFTTDQQLDVTVHVWLVCQSRTLYCEIIKQTVQWWTKCIVKQGDYVKKLRSCKISALVFINMKHTVRIIIDSPLHDLEITNKMQPCIRIYYSTVHWKLNMFGAAYRSSSGALTVFAASSLYTHVVTGRSQVWVGTQTWLGPVTTCVRKPEDANRVRAPDDERYAAPNMLSLYWKLE